MPVTPGVVELGELRLQYLEAGEGPLVVHLRHRDQPQIVTPLIVGWLRG